jgi:outer membrane protein with beta-barrel domain
MKRLIALTIGICTLALPATARADWTVSPFVGASFGADAPHTSPTGGVTAGWMGKMIGGEIDLGYAPQFFEQNNFLTDRRMVTIMGNAVYGLPWGRTEMVTPYVSGGLGVIKPKLTEAGGVFAFERNKFGMNLGAGATGWVNKNVGVRGDIRYFRGLRQQDADANDFGLDLSTFHFWRASVGLSARF